MGTTTYEVAGFFILPRLAFKSNRDKLLFYDIVQQANYRDDAECKRGQHITSALKIAKENDWTVDQVRTSLKRLVVDGLIHIETFKDRKKGIKVTISGYNDMQKLDSYKPKNPELNPKFVPEYNPELEPNRNVDVPTVEGATKQDSPELNPKLVPEYDPDSLTAFKQQYKQQGKHIKDLPVQIRSKDDVETFVDSQMLVNAMSLPRKLFVEYFNTIRLVRRTGTLSENVAKKIWDKLHKCFGNKKQSQEANTAILLYALSVHVMKHDDKDENYTFGIIRNTSELEARQKYMKLVNKRNGGERIESSEICDRQRRAVELDSLSL